jgi:cytosine/adenosine deaminase-related metal-dependent hydrolase
LTEEEAFKMVTLNPAKALHVDDRVGSIKVGKDADLVLWSDNPLAYMQKQTKLSLMVLFILTVTRDKELRKQISAERNRLIQKMIAEGKNNPKDVIPARTELTGCTPLRRL